MRWAPRARGKFRRRSEGKIQWQIRHLITAIGHVTQQDLVAAHGVHRLQDVDIDDILDLAARIARSQRQVSDDGVEGTLRVQFAKRTAYQFLILSDLTERYAVEGRRLDVINNDFCDHDLYSMLRRSSHYCRVNTVRWSVAMRSIVAAGSGPAATAATVSASSVRFLAPVTTVLTPGRLNA